MVPSLYHHFPPHPADLSGVRWVWNDAHYFQRICWIFIFCKIHQICLQIIWLKDLNAPIFTLARSNPEIKRQDALNLHRICWILIFCNFKTVLEDLCILRPNQKSIIHPAIGMKYLCQDSISIFFVTLVNWCYFLVGDTKPK